MTVTWRGDHRQRFRKTVQVFSYKAVLNLTVRDNDIAQQYVPDCRVNVIQQQTGQVLLMANTRTGGTLVLRFEKPEIVILGVYKVGYQDHIQSFGLNWDTSIEVLLDRSYFAGMSEESRLNIEAQPHQQIIEHNGGIWETWNGVRWYRSDSAGNEIVADVGVFSKGHGFEETGTRVDEEESP